MRKGENKSIQGKAESAVWKRDATLRDLLNLLDAIEASDKMPEEKAKLIQRVVDYGQHLSEEIYLGKRKVPETDDNQTIKEFNIRFHSTYYTKGESSYEEAKRPTGYYDEQKCFVSDPYTTPNPGTRNHKNPRWHPIPLRDIDVTPPENTSTGGGGTTVPPVSPENTPQSGGGTVIPPVSPGNTPQTTGGTVIPPVSGVTKPATNSQTNDLTNTNGSDSDVLTRTEQTKEEKKHRHYAPWLIPLIAAAILVADKSKSAQNTSPVNDGQDKDKTELVQQTPALTQAENEFLRYTVEKGQRMAAKQFGVSVDEGAEIYNQFVENIKQGKLPESMKALTETYQMSKMVNNDLGLDLDRPEIAATSWLLMSASYEAITPVVHQAITKPEEQTTPANEVRLNKYLSMANYAAKKYKVDPQSNLVSTFDYGLYGASKKTGGFLSYRSTQDKIDYGLVRDSALQDGVGY